MGFHGVGTVVGWERYGADGKSDAGFRFGAEYGTKIPLKSKCTKTDLLATGRLAARRRTHPLHCHQAGPFPGTEAWRAGRWLN